ncbi:MAG: hypothetical protein IJ004_01350 [Clostridia bacterium]|nr:hypothetical protein [Clostridia bacterium]
MKRLSIILLLLFALALGSCGTPPPQSETGNEDTTPNTTITDTSTDTGITTNSQVVDTSTQGGLIDDPSPELPSDPQPDTIDPVLIKLDKVLADAISGYESLTTLHDIIIIKEDGSLILGAMLYKSAKNTTYTSELVNSLDGDFNGSITRKEIRTLDDDFLGIDTIYGKSYYLPEGDGWRRYDGSYLEESIFSFIALGNLRLSIRDFTYDKETDLYKSTSIKGYSSISNLEIKLNDTHISHISYECGGTYPGAKKEYHTLTLYDINETKISGPTSELVEDYTEPLYYFEEEELATISRQTACFLAEYHYRNYLDKSPEDILSLHATCLSAGEYYTIYLSGAKDTPGPQDNAEEINLTYKITPEGEILLLR